MTDAIRFLLQFNVALCSSIAMHLHLRELDVFVTIKLRVKTRARKEGNLCWIRF